MYREFIFPCEKPLMDRFGLNCYGCCEPLHHRWPAVKQHPRLRRVSCSPWADLAKMAESLDGKYILSLKPNPAAIASPAIDEQAVRQWLRKAIEHDEGVQSGNHHERQPHDRPIGRRTSCGGAKLPKRRSTR